MKKNLYLTAKDCSSIRLWNKTTLSWICDACPPKGMKRLCKFAADYQLWTDEKVVVCGIPKCGTRYIIIKEF